MQKKSFIQNTAFISVFAQFVATFRYHADNSFTFTLMASTWYKRKWVIVLLHAAVWNLVFLFPLFLQQSLQNTRREHVDVDRNLFTYLTVFTDILWVLLFYFNARILIPRLSYKKKYVTYTLIQLVIVGVLILFQWLFFTFVIKQLHFDLNAFLLFNIFPYLFILACSTAYRVIQDRMEAEQLSQEKVTENLKTELSFLRSQVSPHFMFNVLNNMVALARKKSELLEPSLIQLSSLLRYMLYETDEEKVPLQKEIEYLHSYIDLQQQRFGKKLVVNVDFVPAGNACEIEPMLLIPFVENAFKHGTGIVENPQIDIELRAKNQLLQFSVRNRYNSQSTEIKDKTSGIGLTNVQRRLNLLYGNNHTLLITKKDGWFITSLQLNLH